MCYHFAVDRPAATWTMYTVCLACDYLKTCIDHLVQLAPSYCTVSVVGFDRFHSLHGPVLILHSSSIHYYKATCMHLTSPTYVASTV